MSEPTRNQASCLALLCERQKKLDEAGEKRLVKKSDFPPEQVAAIKALFGPWPRALEAAGLKEKRSDELLLKNREKHLRVKRARTREKIQKKTRKAP